MPTKVLSNKLPWITSCVLLLAAPSPAKAFSVNLNTFTDTSPDAALSRVNSNINADSTINQTVTPEGFGSFFAEEDNPFLLLGASSGTTIPLDDHGVGVSIATSENIVILEENANKDLVLNFDWIFQGNSEGTLGLIDDTFSVALVGAGTDLLGNTVNVETDLLVTNEYGSKRGEELAISGGLNTGTYNIVISLTEPSIDPLDPIDPLPLLSSDVPLAAGPSDNSAAGIDNLSVSSVPFEFSPTTGLFIVGGFWGLLRWQKRKNIVSNNELKS
jgi:hypothetical protein